MNIDEVFGGMADKPISGRGSFFTEGLYTVEVLNVFANDGYKGKSFIVNAKVLESNTDAHKPGVTRDYIVSLEKKPTDPNGARSFGDITKFILACLGHLPSGAVLKDSVRRKEAERVARAVCGSETAKAELGADYEEGMLQGVRLKLECTTIKTLNNTDFTVHAWSPEKVA